MVIGRYANLGGEGVERCYKDHVDSRGGGGCPRGQNVSHTASEILK